MREATRKLLEEHGIDYDELQRRRRLPGDVLYNPNYSKVSVKHYQAPNIINIREKTALQRMQLVPHNIPKLLREYFGFDPMPFHVELLELMFKGGKYVINWPTDHAKSMVSSYWFPILSLMHNPNESHIICGANSTDSRRRVRAIKNALTPDGYVSQDLKNTALLRDYPWIMKPEGRSIEWSALALNVAGRETNKPNASVISATSSVGDVRGRRGKMIMDDLEGRKHRYSPVERQNLYEFIQLEANRCYEDKNESDRPLLVALGTPFYVDSVYFRLEQLGWQVRRTPYKTQDGTAHTPFDRQGQLIWPAKAEKIDELRKNFTKQEFSIAMEMDPKGGDTSILSFQEIARLASDTSIDWASKEMVCKMCSGAGSVFIYHQGRMLWSRCKDCNGQQRSVEPIMLVTLDPASGSKTRFADYAGIAAIRIIWVIGEQLPRVEILEAYQFTDGIFEQVKLCAKLALDYQCEVVYEANSQQGNNYEQVFQHLERTGAIPPTKINKFWTTANKKWDGKLDVTILKTMLRNERLMVPESRHQDDGIRALFLEIQDLGSESHDHIAMSIWMGIRWAYDHHRMGRAATMKSPFAPSIAGKYMRGGRFGWTG